MLFHILRLPRPRPELAVFQYPRFLKFIYGDISIARVMYPPIILLPEDLYRRVCEHGEQDPDAFAVIIHERAHLERLKATFPLFGPLVFGLRFLFGDTSFVIREELYAIEHEMRYRRARGVSYNIERKARQFSSPLYGNLMSYEDAQGRLRVLWESTRGEAGTIHT